MGVERNSPHTEKPMNECWRIWATASIRHFCELPLSLARKIPCAEPVCIGSHKTKADAESWLARWKAVYAEFDSFTLEHFIPTFGEPS